MKQSNCHGVAGRVWQRMQQKKHINTNDTDTSLQRCLTLKRLTFIGIGKTVGVGIYVLIGEATIEAGPSIILSFLIAFVVTLLNGMCFAEYAAKNPKTGAQYTYMYESIGEAMAFLVGWTSIIGYVAALSMALRGWSGYMDSLFNHAISNYTIHHVGNWSETVGPPFPEYLDIMAISILVVVMIITSVGVNFATTLNSLLAFVSGSLLIFITVIGIVYADTDNWFNQPGGFFPGGAAGVLKASAACFYAFQGFEVLAYSAEETVDPKKNVPRSIIATLVVVTLLYLCVAVSFTLMIPYTAVDRNAPFPSAFHYNNVFWAKYLIEIGPILALTNLSVLEMYTVQRLVYSMASDGLLFEFLSKVNPWSKVPIGPVLTFGPVVVVLIVCIDLSTLIGFMVIYTFIQYSFFSAYLIVMRYNPKKTLEGGKVEQNGNAKGHNSDSSLWTKFKTCSVKKLVAILYVTLFLLASLIAKRMAHIKNGGTFEVLAITLLTLMILTVLLMIYKRNQEGDCQGFLVPCMPLLPATSVFCNHLMLMSVIDLGSFLASFILAAVGAAIYLTLVICSSIKESCHREDRAQLLDNDEDEHEL